MNDSRNTRSANTVPTRRWLKLSWRFALCAFAAWLALAAWFSQPLAPWTRGWVGWWSGDGQASRPLWNWGADSPRGWETVSTRGDSFYRIHFDKPLGNWRYDTPWTWAGWVRLTAPPERLRGHFLIVWMAASTKVRLEVGFDGGKPRASFLQDGPDGAAVRLDLKGATEIQAEDWTHLAVTSDGKLLRLLVNGAVADEFRTCAGCWEIYLASMQLV